MLKKYCIYAYNLHQKMNSLQNISIKLVQGLNLLSQAEFNKFVIFSSSKYFSEDRDYSKLLEALRKMHISGFKSHNNQTLINHLVEKLNMSKHTILNRMSELHKIYEKFAVNEYMNSNNDKKSFLLLNYYLNKKSSKLFEYVLNSYKSELRKEKIDTERIETEFLLTELSAIKDFKSAKFKLYNEQFSQKSEFQIYSFVLKLIKENIEFQQQKFTGNSAESGLSDLVIKSLPIDAILEKLKASGSEYHNIAMLLYEMYLSFRDFTKTEHFKAAKKIHLKIKSDLKRNENHFIYSLLITYCIDQTNLGRPEFYIELFKLIDEKLSDGYFDELKTPNIPVNNFRDYVIIGLRVNKIEWVKKFIKEYSVYLPVEYRQDDVNLANGLIALEENKFEEAIAALSKVKKKNYIHYLDSSFNMLRAYYKLNLFYDAFKEIDKIKEYFSRNKNIPSKIIKLNITLLKEFKLLLKYSERKSEYENLYLYCKNVNFSMKSKWLTGEVKKIFKVET